MTCGIYMIQNLKNNKIYIGQAVDIESRWGNHKRELRNNKHYNEHLQKSWSRYGEDSFKFTIICECNENQLNTMEEYYIFELMSYDRDVGYNKTYGGGSCRRTEETRKKLSKANKGKTFSEEHRKKISEAAKRAMSIPEIRKKMSEANKGKTRSKETRKKMSEANKGKTLSEEHRKKISESLKGENHPMYGKHLPEETIRKMSESRGKGVKNPSSIPLVQLTLDGKLVEVYGSSAEAGRNEFNQRAVNSCCRGKSKTHKGYKWMYLYDYISKMHPNIKTINLFGKTYEVNQEEVK